jgi:hypothetical protein
MPPRRAATSNHVGHDFARKVAAHAYSEALAAGLHGLDQVSAAAVADPPLTIYDLDGEPLFHDYALVDDFGDIVGTVRTAANKILGSPLVSISHAPPGWDPAQAISMANESLHADSAKATVVSARFVCYAYPKIAVELTYALGRRKATQLFDAASGAPIARSREESNQFTAYSLIGRLKDQSASRLREFRAAETIVERLPDVSGSALRNPWPTTSIPVTSIYWTRQQTVLLSPYCAGSPIGLSHYAQITNYFCVPASAQMLLEHYGWNYTQNELATAMGTNAAQGGTTGSGLTTGFASMTHNQFSLTFDNGATRAQQFTDAVTEINANRPLFTQVPHHYRVCVGYSELLGLLLGSVSQQMLYIYDPWPWNPDLCQPGAPYWESWATSPVMWFGIVQHA